MPHQFHFWKSPNPQWTQMWLGWTWVFKEGSQVEMKSLGWASSSRAGVLTGEGGEDADTGRGKTMWGHSKKMASTSQEERPQKKSSPPTPWSQTFSLHICAKASPCCLSPLSAVLHEGGSNKWKQSFTWYIFLRPWWKDPQDMSHWWNKGVISWGVTNVWGEGRLVQSSVASEVHPSTA